ncbi:MAG: asparaginase domain-containing protein [Patescibacteria group bacterium]|jgi:L-asparaginase
MQSLSQKKICLLYAGGTTFGPDFNLAMLKKWISNSFELQMMAQVEPYFVWHGAGADVPWDLAGRLTTIIKDNYKKYDGFVITHSIDNIVYTSSLLAFMAQNTGKPIIFTGPALPEENEQIFFQQKKKPISFGEFETLAIKSGLINAVQIATMDNSEVGVVIGNHLVRATQAKFNWDDPGKYLSFFQKHSLARIQFGIHLNNYVKKRHENDPEFNGKFISRVKILDVHPESEADLANKDYAGIFIRGFQEQLYPSRYNLPKHIPVCVYSQGTEIKSDNVFICSGINYETAVAKFVWVLGQTSDIKKVKKLMGQNLAGEF